MKTVVGFLLMSLQVAHAVKPSCDGRENGTQCFGVLGGAVDIQLMDNVSEIRTFNWIMNNSLILKWANNKIIPPEDDRIPFFPSNTTVRIKDLRRTDSGEYKLEMFDRNGNNIGWRTLQLFVIAPVSSVQLVHECLSQGQMKVSCVSQGDSPQYSWTLDGHTLTNSEIFSRNTETNIIFLRQNISGRLICSVRNEVSDSFEEMNLAGCGFIFINCTSNETQIAKWVYKENNTLCVEPTTVPPTTKYTSVGKKTQSNTSASSSNDKEQHWYIKLLPVMGGVLAALVIVLVASIAFICVHKKKKNTKVVEKEDDDQEMTYADVRIVKKQGRRVEKSEEADVEYGQVKFSKKPRISQTNPTVDDTVYAQVRKGR